MSGYPRNTADLLNYLDRLERVDGVILINWHDEAIKAQIEYGAKEGQIQLQAAKAELRHYKKHVISVAQYFDFKQLLYVVGNFHFLKTHTQKLVFLRSVNFKMSFWRPKIFQETKEIFSRISAQASKKRWNQKNKGTLYH